MGHSDFKSTLEVVERGRVAGLHLGAQLYVWQNGQTLLDEAVGEAAPHVPLRTSHLLLWLSAVKPVTAIAFARLVEDGRFDWDTPVSATIREFAQCGKGLITPRHLLTHTAGFRSADQLGEDLGWDEMIRGICTEPLESGWVPGEKAGYQTGSSWFILGEMIRRVSGEPVEVFVRQHVLLPAGMNDCWLGMPGDAFAEYGSRIAPMHVGRGEGVIPHPDWNSKAACTAIRPGSNGRGPVSQLGRLYQILLQGRLGQERVTARPGSVAARPLLKPETIRMMTTRQRVGMFDHTFQHMIDWGLGFVINSNRYGATTVPYGYGQFCSEETFGHSGAQSSCAFADPMHGLVVAWVFNTMPGERLHQRRARELNEAIYRDVGLG